MITANQRDLVARGPVIGDDADHSAGSPKNDGDRNGEYFAVLRRSEIAFGRRRRTTVVMVYANARTSEMRELREAGTERHRKRMQPRDRPPTDRHDGHGSMVRPQDSNNKVV